MVAWIFSILDYSIYTDLPEYITSNLLFFHPTNHIVFIHGLQIVH